MTMEIEKGKDAYIRQFSEKVGKQIGQTVTDLVAEIYLLMIERRSSVPMAMHPETAIPEKRLLSAGEVADTLHISRSMAYRMMQRGEIPTVRMGRVARVRLQDLERYIATHVY